MSTFFWSPNTFTYRSMTQFSNHLCSCLQVWRSKSFGISGITRKLIWDNSGNTYNSKTALLALCDANMFSRKAIIHLWECSTTTLLPSITSSQIVATNSDQCKGSEHITMVLATLLSCWLQGIVLANSYDDSKAISFSEVKGWICIATNVNLSRCSLQTLTEDRWWMFTHS